MGETGELLWGCSSHTLAWLASSSAGYTSFPKQGKALAKRTGAVLQAPATFFGGWALRRNHCRLPALPFCKQLACPQPQRWAEAWVPPGFMGNIPMPCVSPSLGRGRARWRRGALVQMGNLLGGHRCHCLDFMLAGLNKWCVLWTARSWGDRIWPGVSARKQ